MEQTNAVDNDLTRFSPITADDHAGHLWIVAIIGPIYTILALILRASVKRGIYGWDDSFGATATLFHLAQSAAICAGLTAGLGKANSLSVSHEVERAGKAYFAAEILCIIVLSLAKCSVAAVMLRLWQRGIDFTKWALCFGTFVLSALWGIASVITILTDCVPSATLTQHNIYQCSNQNSRWLGITSVDVLTDTILAVLPVILAWSLIMSLKRKAQVSLIFTSRLLVLPLSILHFVYFQAYPESSQPRFAISRGLIFQQIMLVTSLLTATALNLKSFLNSFNWGFGMATRLEDRPIRAATSSMGRFELQTIGHGTTRYARRRNTFSSWENDHLATSNGTVSFRPDDCQYEAIVSGPFVSRVSSNSGHFDARTPGMIIKKHSEWTVERH